MGCCDGNSVQLSKMALEIKSGPMLWYKRRFFGSNWRDYHSVLYNDSSYIWYKDKSRQESKGGVVLKEAPELIAFGTYTSRVPDRPDLPDHYEFKELLAFGVRGTKTVYWFLCQNEEEMTSWMGAIASTLPTPPAPPQIPPPPQIPAPTAPPNSNEEQTPASPYPTEHTAEPMSTCALGGNDKGLPGQYPQQTNHRPQPYYANNTVSHYPQPYPSGGGGPTTVVVQQDRPGYVVGGVGGVFAMGMLSAGWGSHYYHHGFGGLGTGGGWCHGPIVRDTNIHFNNYYDNDTITMNNVKNRTNTSIEQTATEQTAIEQTATQQTATQQTATQQTATQQTATQQTATQQTATQQTATQQTATQQTATEQSATEQTATEQTATEQTATEQTATEQTATEQTAIEQTVPEPAPVMAEEYTPVQDQSKTSAPVTEPVEYLPIENAGGGMFDAGDYDAYFGGYFGGGDFGGGDFGGGDFGGGDFGGGDFGGGGFVAF